MKNIKNIDVVIHVVIFDMNYFWFGILNIIKCGKPNAIVTISNYPQWLTSDCT